MGLSALPRLQPKPTHKPARLPTGPSPHAPATQATAQKRVSATSDEAPHCSGLSLSWGAPQIYTVDCGWDTNETKALIGCLCLWLWLGCETAPNKLNFQTTEALLAWTTSECQYALGADIGRAVRNDPIVGINWLSPFSRPVSLHRLPRFVITCHLVDIAHEILAFAGAARQRH